MKAFLFWVGIVFATSASLAFISALIGIGYGYGLIAFSIVILGYYIISKKGCNKVISYYTKAILLNPNDAEAYINRGNVHGYWDYAAIKESNKAIADYESALQIDPNHLDARIFLENIKKRVKITKGLYVLYAASIALAIALFIGGYNPYYGEEEYLKRLEQR